MPHGRLRSYVVTGKDESDASDDGERTGQALPAHLPLKLIAERGGAFHARARGATIRRDLIDVAAGRHGRGHITIHLPQGWHREQHWMNLFQATCHPPPAQAA